MSNQPSHLIELRNRCRMCRNIVAVAFLAALSLGARPAAAAQYFYSGHDAAYSNIIMELYITTTSAGNDVTGVVRCGNVVMHVKGMLAGNNLNANVTSQPSAGALSVARATGALKGALGTGGLDVSAGPVNINGRAVTLSFALTPPAPNAPGVISHSGLRFPPQPRPLALPSALRLVGGTGFGYTRLTLNLDLVLRGSSYAASGFIVVNQLILVKFSPPRNVQTTLRVTGMLTPGTTGALSVIGAPPGNFPHFVGALGLTGAPFQGFLSGIPSLGITGLTIGARPEALNARN